MKKKLVKNLLLVLTMVVLCLAVGISASAYTEGYYTYIVEDGEAIITYVDSSVSGDVAIPETLGGYPVVYIDSNYDLYNVTRIIIPHTVRDISSNTFCYCPDLIEFVVDDNNEYFDSVDGVLYKGTVLRAFPGNKKVELYEIIDGTTQIYDRVFYCNTNVKSLYIPKSVSYISGNFTDSSFYCAGIENYYVDDENPYFISENGVVYNKDKTVLVAYPGGREAVDFTIPATVKKTLGCNGGGATIKTLSFEQECDFEEWENYFFYFGSIERLIIPCNVDPSAVVFCNPVKTETVIFEKGTKEIVLNKISLLYYDTLDLPVNIIKIEEKAIQRPIYGNSNLNIIIRNFECDIYDSADTIYEGATIYGYKNSTAQAYAEKYGRKFVALECEHSSYEYTYVEANGCNNAYEYFECTICGDKKDKKELPNTAKHSYNATVTLPTCITRGKTVYTCGCGDSYVSDYVNALDHKDVNGDYKCDYGCGYEFEKLTPEEPTEPNVPEEPEEEEKNFIEKIIEWFKNFFDKLFGWMKR